MYIDPVNRKNWSFRVNKREEKEMYEEGRLPAAVTETIEQACFMFASKISIFNLDLTYTIAVGR